MVKEKLKTRLVKINSGKEAGGKGSAPVCVSRVNEKGRIGNHLKYIVIIICAVVAAVAAFLLDF